ncbi:MAG: methyltransferase, partial [Rhodospirillaceae bacterium]|nr:methyltransferase [Rhodospirillaceae bacterium]
MEQEAIARRVVEPLETTRNTLLGGRIVLHQPRRGARATGEPVLLAAALQAAPGQTVLDAGAGTGAASLCLAHRLPGLAVTALEVQPSLAELARRNAVENGGSDAIRVIEGDLAVPPSGVGRIAFDHVMTNPPFFLAGRGRPSPDESRSLARREAALDLAAWLRACLARLKPGGTITAIHRAERLGELLAVLDGRTGGLRVHPLWPVAGRSAKLVLV